MPMTRFFFILSLVVAILAALLVTAMNSVRVDVELAFGRVASSLGAALVVAFAVGVIMGLLWHGYWLAELLTERGRLRRALRVAEARAREAAATGPGSASE
jgi:uncharacterized membrane protein YciS (DUF1049 family)